MVSSGKRKPSKPAKSRKAGSTVTVQIRENIPFNKRAVVTRTEVARKVKKRVVTKSTNVVVPKAPSAPLEPLDSSPPDQDNSQGSNKSTRKGPSRSVAVRSLSPLLYLTNCLTN